MTPDEYKKAIASGAPLHIRVGRKPMIDGLVYLREDAVLTLLPVLKQAAQSQFGDDAHFEVWDDGTLGLRGVKDETVDFMVLDFAALLKPGKRAEPTRDPNCECPWGVVTHNWMHHDTHLSTCPCYIDPREKR